ncbi:hypothetical protein MHK_006863 [Candidatus Magnetomorum sp. HK-1]|nr:hypothetical protein MHK_006863 [Candidatus Magnetomorum sp. HK-1]
MFNIAVDWVSSCKRPLSFEAYGWLFGNTNGQDSTDLTFVINPGDTGINLNKKSVSAENIFDNNWHHVVGIRNNDQIFLYVNGQLISSESGVVQTVNVDSPFIIGSGIGDYIFSGIIDEVAMWKRALSGDDISYLYNGGNANGLPLVDSGLFYKNAKGKKLSRLNAWESKETNISFNGGNVGIGTDHPQTALDVNGGVRVGRFTTSTRPACNDNIVGTFIFDTEKKKPFVCDGNVWKPLDSDYDEDGIVDWNDKDDNDPKEKHVNLKSGNIKSGVDVFGVSGSFTGDATAVASDVKAGKTFYANGQKIVGDTTVFTSDQPAELVSNSGSRLIFKVPAGYYDGTINVYGEDTDLVAGNINDRIDIFGIIGTNKGKIFAQNFQYELDLSGQKGVSTRCLDGKKISQHSSENYHYFLCLTFYCDSHSNYDRQYGIIQIGKYDKKTNHIFYYENQFDPIVDNDDLDYFRYTKIVENIIYFVHGVVNENNANDVDCKWVSFNGNTFSKGSSDKKIFSDSLSPNNETLTYG